MAQQNEKKKTACECLNKCPKDVIQWFFNHSWCFMDAYQQGLTEQVAEWAIWKQKLHWRVGQCAIMSIEAVLVRTQQK